MLESLDNVVLAVVLVGTGLADIIAYYIGAV
jgi:hypothetical protein